MKARYRTYKTKDAAGRYMAQIQARWPERQFVIMPDPRPTFRYVVALYRAEDDIGGDRWIPCA